MVLSHKPLQNRAVGRSAASPQVPAASSPSQSSEVHLHVYDLDRITRMSGLAVYHLGIEVYGFEHFYSVKGILCCKPGGHEAHVHKEVVPLGPTPLGAQGVLRELQELSRDWQGKDYSVLGRNCQTFAVALCERLGLGTECIPAAYRRQAEFGSQWRGGVIANALSRVVGSRSGSGSVSGAGSAP